MIETHDVGKGKDGYQRKRGKLQRDSYISKAATTTVCIVLGVGCAVVGVVLAITKLPELLGNKQVVSPPPPPISTPSTAKPTAKLTPSTYATPSATVASTPNATVTLTPGPTTAPTPVPTVAPFVSSFGVTEATRNTKVNMGNDFEVAYYKVYGNERGFSIKGLLFNKDSNGVYVANVNDRFTGEYIGKVTDKGKPIDINMDYFRKKFRDPSMSKDEVEFRNWGRIESLAAKARELGCKIDDSRLKEMTGEKTYEEIEKWIIELIPRSLLPIVVDYSLYQDTSSNVPTENYDKKVLDKYLFAVIVTYKSKEIDIFWGYADVDRKNVPIVNLFKNEDIVDNKNNINEALFKSLGKTKDDIVSIETPDLIYFAASKYGIDAYKDIRNINSDTSIFDIRELYNNLMRFHEEVNKKNYWYIEPKRADTLKNDYSKYSLKGMLQEPGESQSMRENIRNGVYTLEDLKKVPMTTEELIKSVMSGEQDAKAPKEKVLEQTMNL